MGVFWMLPFSANRVPDDDNRAQDIPLKGNSHMLEWKPLKSCDLTE